jgi:hypothetical protein
MACKSLITTKARVQPRDFNATVNAADSLAQTKVFILKTFVVIANVTGNVQSEKYSNRMRQFCRIPVGTKVFLRNTHLNRAEHTHYCLLLLAQNILRAISETRLADLTPGTNFFSD